MPDENILKLGTFYTILAVALALLMTERLRIDLVAVLVILALAGSRILTPEEALDGFSSEPAIVIASIFVLTGALYQTGLSEQLGKAIGRLAGRTYTQMVAVIMPTVALLSAFTHHVTTTAVMLPVTLNLARERGIPGSKLLMPLSFAASVGTAITIIGAPAFLVASSVLQQSGRPGLAIFDIAPVGLAITAAGTLFMLTLGRLLLPAHPGAETLAAGVGLKEYFTELAILPSSPLVGKRVHDVEASRRYRFDIVGLVRGGHHVTPPFGERRLAAGDVVLAHATPNQLASIAQEPGIELHPVTQYADEGTNGGQPSAGDEPLVQAILAPDSELVGRTLAQVEFHRQYGALVVALWRRGEPLVGELAGIKLREGDVLVLQGDADTLARLREQRGDFLMLVPFHGELRARRKAPLAGLIMLGTIAAATAGVPLQLATVAGAAAVLLTGCLSARQAYRAIDAKIFVFIAGAIPLGKAITKSGAADALAGGLQALVAGWPFLLVLMVIFVVGALVTQPLSDAATVALLGPVAASLAGLLGRPPEAFVVTVAMASVTAVLTPIGHHGNLLIYGPGRYRFADFVRVGVPFTIVSGLVVTIVASLVWRG